MWQNHCRRAGVTDPGEQESGRGSCQIMEIVDEVHLVMVAELIGDIHPWPLRKTDFEIQGGLKSRYAGKEFRGKADVLQEPPLEVSRT